MFYCQNFKNIKINLSFFFFFSSPQDKGFRKQKIKYTKLKKIFSINFIFLQIIN